MSLTGTSHSSSDDDAILAAMANNLNQDILYILTEFRNNKAELALETVEAIDIWSNKHPHAEIRQLMIEIRFIAAVNQGNKEELQLFIQALKEGEIYFDKNTFQEALYQAIKNKHPYFFNKILAVQDKIYSQKYSSYWANTTDGSVQKIQTDEMISGKEYWVNNGVNFMKMKLVPAIKEKDNRDEQQLIAAARAGLLNIVKQILTAFESNQIIISNSALKRAKQSASKMIKNAVKGLINKVCRQYFTFDFFEGYKPQYQRPTDNAICWIKTASDDDGRIGDLEIITNISKNAALQPIKQHMQRIQPALPDDTLDVMGLLGAAMHGLKLVEKSILARCDAQRISIKPEISDLCTQIKNNQYIASPSLSYLPFKTAKTSFAADLCHWFDETGMRLFAANKANAPITLEEPVTREKCTIYPINSLDFHTEFNGFEIRLIGAFEHKLIAAIKNIIKDAKKHTSNSFSSKAIEHAISLIADNACPSLKKIIQSLTHNKPKVRNTKKPHF